MPGFRFCQWCKGSGCMCCEAEERNYAKKAMARVAMQAPAWREPDIRDVRNAALEDETKRLKAQIGITISSQEEFNRIEAAAHEEIERMFQPALDAEYARQFPNGPESMFTAKIDNPADMALMKHVMGRETLNRVYSDGVTKEALGEMMGLLEGARRTQAARQVLAPNEKDLGPV